MISWLKSLIVDYGAINVLIMALTILITNVIKKPIKNKADKLANAAKTLLGVDLDKSVITSNIVYIPIGVSFVLYFIYTLVLQNFVVDTIDWGSLVSNSLVYGMLSVSLFDIVKAKLNAYKDKNVYEDVKKKLSELEEQNDLLIKEDNTQDTNNINSKENENGKEND